MNSRETALSILLKLDRDKAYVNKALADSFKHSSFTDADKGLITEIVMGCVKRRELLDFYIMQFSKVKIRKMSDIVRNILEIGAYQIIFLDKIPNSAACNESVKLAKRHAVRSSGFVNGILRSLARSAEDGSIKQPERDGDDVQYLSIVYSYPEWLVEALVKQYGSEICERIFEAADKPYHPMIRANLLKSEFYTDGEFDSAKVIKMLMADGIEIVQDDDLKECFHVIGRLDINSSKTYKDGFYTLQNKSSQAAVIALEPKPDDFIIDVCAAPGGKTTGIAERMHNRGRIIAFDIHEHKTKLIDNAAKRLGISIINNECRDASQTVDEYINSADRVLVDAPCSGFGVIHTKPDIKRYRTKDDAEKLVIIQKNILNASAKYVKPGGVLVYSTCTILRSENEQQIKNFLSEHSDFELVYENLLLTYLDGGSGFYIAKLRRKLCD